MTRGAGSYRKAAPFSRAASSETAGAVPALRGGGLRRGAEMHQVRLQLVDAIVAVGDQIGDVGEMLVQMRTLQHDHQDGGRGQRGRRAQDEPPVLSIHSKFLANER